LAGDFRWILWRVGSFIESADVLSAVSKSEGSQCNEEDVERDATVEISAWDGGDYFEEWTQRHR
jgi:hypothetical protein